MDTTPTLDQRLVTICQTVRSEALEPAIKEAESIRIAAGRERDHILAEARKHAEERVQFAEEKAKEIQKSTEIALRQAGLQAIDLLKEHIEKNLFHHALDSYITDSLKNDTACADLIEALITSLDKQGIFGDIECEIGKSLSKDAVNCILGQKILARLHTNSVTCADTKLGVVIRVAYKNIVIDITDKAIKELLSSFLRLEFRKMLFGPEST